MTANFAKLFSISDDAVEKELERMSQSRKECKRNALLGDCLLNFHVTEFLLEKFPERDVGGITENKKKYLSNQSMSRFVNGILGNIALQGDTLEHLEGTFFETLVYCHYDKYHKLEKSFVEAWISWADENISHSEAAFEIPTLKKFCTTINLLETVEDIKSKLKESNAVVQPKIERNKNSAEVTITYFTFDNIFSKEDTFALVEKEIGAFCSETLLQLDNLPTCINCNQRRCTIFIADNAPCRSCASCRYACRILDREMVYYKPNKPYPAYGSRFKTPTVDITVGVPIHCTKCQFTEIGLDHCSNKCKCHINGCSNKYPCQKYTVWECLNCEAVGRVGREGR